MIFDKSTIYYNEENKPHYGYFIDDVWKDNLDVYAKRRIAHRLDNIFIVSGLEGSGKTTFASMCAKYLDPTFPGALLNDGTPRRRCDRIVFTINQIMKAIDTAKIGQSIQIDEAIITLGSQDAANDFQKLLIKKFTTIRKKRLNIFLLIPNFFMVRKPIAVFRSFALMHTHLIEGFRRGSFSVYSYDRKQSLYFRGVKDHNMRCVPSDFTGHFGDTHGYFYDVDEYDRKKEEAIKYLSEFEDNKGGAAREALKKMTKQRNKILYVIYAQLSEQYRKVNKKSVYTMTKCSEDLKKLYGFNYTPILLSKILKDGKEQFNIVKKDEVIDKMADF